MPVVIAPLVWILFIVATFLASTAQLWVRPLAEALADHVPLIGGRIRAAVGAISDRVESVLRRFAKTAEDAGVRWLTGIAGAARELADETAAFAVRTASAFEQAIHVTVHEIVKAFLAPVREVAVRGEALAKDVAADLGRLAARVEDVALPAIRRSVAAADRRLDVLVESTLPALRRGLEADVARVRAQVGEVVLPRLRGLEVELPDVRSIASGARRAAERANEWIGPVAAVFGAAAVVSLLRHVRHCQPKTERLCKLDLDELDELLGVGLGLVSLAEIVTMVRSSARAGDELRGLLRLID